MDVGDGRGFVFGDPCPCRLEHRENCIDLYPGTGSTNSPLVYRRPGPDYGQSLLSRPVGAHSPTGDCGAPDRVWWTRPNSSPSLRYHPCPLGYAPDPLRLRFKYGTAPTKVSPSPRAPVGMPPVCVRPPDSRPVVPFRSLSCHTPLTRVPWSPSGPCPVHPLSGVLGLHRRLRPRRVKWGLLSFPCRHGPLPRSDLFPVRPLRPEP